MSAQPEEEKMTKHDFPPLECPMCGIERKPYSLNKDGSVTYSCRGNPDKHAGYYTYTWRITEDGDLIAKR